MRPDPIADRSDLTMEWETGRASDRATASSPPAIAVQQTLRRRSIPTHTPAIASQLLAQVPRLVHPSSSPAALAAVRASMTAALATGVQKSMQFLDQHTGPALQQLAPLATPATLQLAYASHDQQAYAMCLPDFQAAFDLLSTLAPEVHEEQADWLQQQCDIEQETILARLAEVFAEAGWPIDFRAGIEWEAGSPLVCLRHGDMASMTLVHADQFSGEHGLVSSYLTAGKLGIAAKSAKPGKAGTDLLSHEFRGYRHVISKLGPHRNLMTPIGSCLLPKNGQPVRHFLLVMVDGPQGDAVFAALRKCRSSGKLSEREIIGAQQFILRRLLSVVNHFRQAGIVCNDISPYNICFDHEGEPILGDLGMWSWENGTAKGCTPIFAAPEAMRCAPVDHRSDLVSLAATLVHAFDGDQLYMLDDAVPVALWPSTARALDAPPISDLSAWRRHPADRNTTPYEQAVARLLHPDPEQRPHLATLLDPDPARHTEADRVLLAFLNQCVDGIAAPSDDEAKAIILQALALMPDAQKASPPG